jgi:hypothetical protein
MISPRSYGLAVLIAGSALLSLPVPSEAQRAPDLMALARQSLAKIEGELTVPGLHQPVEIIRDRW